VSRDSSRDVLEDSAGRQNQANGRQTMTVPKGQKEEAVSQKQSRYPYAGKGDKLADATQRGLIDAHGHAQGKVSAQ
jgi:hypothetical protein